MYKTSDQADRIRAIWHESLSTIESSDARNMGWDAGDNAAQTLLDQGINYRDENGDQTDEFVFFWEASVVGLLSDGYGQFNSEEAREWYAKRGIVA